VSDLSGLTAAVQRDLQLRLATWPELRVCPREKPMCGVLQSRREMDDAIWEAQDLGLPWIGDPRKSWDALAALAACLRHVSFDDEILDAGALWHSPVLCWLALHGYRRLTGCNLIFSNPVQIGPIRFEQADITGTPYRSAQFAAVTCLSVLEHGVDRHSFFSEMHRILKAGGLLFLSVDYADRPLSFTSDQGPHEVFDADRLADLLAQARRVGFQLAGEVPARRDFAPIAFNGNRYTFLTLGFFRSV
jgi:hypothetical protein